MAKKSTKTTKSTLQKENEALKNKIEELQKQVDTLTKDKMSLQLKLDWYESLPKAATDVIGGGIDFILKSTFPPQQQAQK